MRPNSTNCGHRFLRTTYFEKDNDARTGSKGDFIYRETSDDGEEFISIMFEMKNEMDTTATKLQERRLFQGLDKDRREKELRIRRPCPHAGKPTTRFTTQIVDVSYKYPKMYVVRPQFFIPIITVLRNAALNSLKYRTELAQIRGTEPGHHPF